MDSNGGFDFLTPELFSLLADYIAKYGPSDVSWKLHIDNGDFVISRKQIINWLVSTVGLDSRLLILETAEDWRGVKAKVKLLSQSEDFNSQAVQKNQLENLQMQKELADKEKVDDNVRREKFIDALMKKVGLTRDQAEMAVDSVVNSDGEMAEKAVSQMAKNTTVLVRQPVKEVDKTESTGEVAKFRSAQTEGEIKNAEERAQARGNTWKREPFRKLGDSTVGEIFDYLKRMGIIGDVGLPEGSSREEFLAPDLAQEIRTSDMSKGTGLSGSAKFIQNVGQQILQDKLVGALEGALGVSQTAATVGTAVAEGTAVTGAVAAGGTAVAAGATVAGEVAVSGTLAATGPVGWVVAAGLFLKSLPKMAVGLFRTLKNSFFGKAASEAAANAGSSAQVFAKRQSGGIFSVEGISAIFGAALGTFIFPTPVVGTIIGGILGGILGGGLKSAFSFGGGSGGNGDGSNSKLKKAGLAVILVGTSPTSIMAWVFIGFGAIFILNFLGQGQINEIFAQPVEHESLGQVSKAVFSVQKTATPSELPNYDGTKATVTYKLVITPESSTFKVNSIVDEKKRTGKNGDVTLGKENLDVTKLVANGNNLELSYSYDISGANFKDSYLINTATVEGVDTTTNEKETQVASFAVRINNPPTQQPYGFPAVGTVTSLDRDKAGADHWSCFKVFGCSQKMYGGIDIAAKGDVAVFSTSEGKVMSAGFDSDPINGVGGYVYVQSGPYVVEYLHLQTPSVTTGQTVTRHMQIGKTYQGTLPTSSGQHVHYQVALNKGNVNFNEANNAGSCLNGKIEPVKPPDYPGQIMPEWVAPRCE